MTKDTLEILGALLLSHRLTEMEAMTLQAMMRMALMREREGEERGARLLIAESDRDNRRRRMDLAMAILDETQVHDLDRVAEIIWPDNKQAAVSLRMECDGNHGGPACADVDCWHREPEAWDRKTYGPPVPGDPTQQPTRMGPNARCPKNPEAPYVHVWGSGMEPECTFGCGAKLLKSQSISRTLPPECPKNPSMPWSHEFDTGGHCIHCKAFAGHG